MNKESPRAALYQAQFKTNEPSADDIELQKEEAAVATLLEAVAGFNMDDYDYSCDESSIDSSIPTMEHSPIQPPRLPESEDSDSPTPRGRSIRLADFESSTPQHQPVSLAEYKRSPPGAATRYVSHSVSHLGYPFLPSPTQEDPRGQSAELTAEPDHTNDEIVHSQDPVYWFNHEALCRLEPRDLLSILYAATSGATSGATSSNSSRSDQKTYLELFSDVNDKIELICRSYVSIDAPGDPEERRKFKYLASSHVNYKGVAQYIMQTAHLQSAFVVGLIWRLVFDTIFDTPVLDQAPSPYAQAFLKAWIEDFHGDPTRSQMEWAEYKRPRMEARTAAARNVIEQTHGFTEWVEYFAATKTMAIVDQLAFAWRQGTKKTVSVELCVPILKLVRIAIRMRSELRHFGFTFLQYGLKARSDIYVQHSEYGSEAPPPPSDDENQHVVFTKVPGIYERDFGEVRLAQTDLYKLEVVVRKNWPGKGHMHKKFTGALVNSHPEGLRR